MTAPRSAVTARCDSAFCEECRTGSTEDRDAYEAYHRAEDLALLGRATTIHEESAMKTNRMPFLCVAAFLLGAALAACSATPAPTGPFPARPVGISGLWMGSTDVRGSALVPVVVRVADNAPADSVAALTGTGTFGDITVSVTGRRSGSTFAIRVAGTAGQGYADLVGQFSGGVFVGTASGTLLAGTDPVYLNRAQ